MIIVIGGIKGGTGKTTLATNLTVMRASKKKKVLLVDADEQKSASDWSDQRIGFAHGNCQFVTISLAGIGLFAQIQKLKDDYDDIIIDVGGRDTTSQRSALSCANIFIIPFKPRSLDIWTLGKLKVMISEIKSSNPSLKCLAVINQADAKGKDNDDALQILKECSDLQCLQTIIGQRKVFSNAASEGLGISEYKVIDKKALQEMHGLYEYIFHQ